MKGRDWVLQKKERQRKQGKNVRQDSKYTGRKRGPKYVTLVLMASATYVKSHWYLGSVSFHSSCYLLPIYIFSDFEVFYKAQEGTYEQLLYHGSREWANFPIYA